MEMERDRRHRYLFQCGFEPPLLSAVSRGDLAKVKALVESGVDLNTLPVLVKAIDCDRCSDELVKYLIASGADVNRESLSGESPLSRAVVERGLGIVKLLLDSGADVCGRYVLSNALKERRGQMIRLMIESGTDPRTGHCPRMVQQLLENGNHPWTEYCSLDTDSRCVCAVLGLLAIDVETLSLVTNAGLDLSYTADIYGISLLEKILHCQSKEMVNFFLENGTDIGRAVHFAIWLGRFDLLGILAEYRIMPTLVSVAYVEIYPDFIRSKNYNFDNSRLKMELNEPDQLVTPFLMSVLTGRCEIAEIFSQSWCLHTRDLLFGKRLRLIKNILKTTNQTKGLDFLQSMAGSLPSLQKLAFIHVSTAIGFSSERKAKIQQLNVPSVFKNNLLHFKSDILKNGLRNLSATV